MTSRRFWPNTSNTMHISTQHDIAHHSIWRPSFTVYHVSYVTVTVFLASTILLTSDQNTWWWTAHNIPTHVSFRAIKSQLRYNWATRFLKNDTTHQNRNGTRGKLEIDWRYVFTFRTSQCCNNGVLTSAPWKRKNNSTVQKMYTNTTQCIKFVFGITRRSY